MGSLGKEDDTIENLREEDGRPESSEVDEDQVYGQEEVETLLL